MTLIRFTLLFFVMTLTLVSCREKTRMNSMHSSISLHLIPLNENFINRNNITVIDISDNKSIQLAKKYLSTRLKEKHLNEKENNKIEKLAGIIKKDSLIISDKEYISQYYIRARYGIFPDEYKLNGYPIDVSDKLEYLIQNNLIKFIFNESYTAGLETKLIVKGTENVYMIAGSDLIRLIEPELRKIGGFDSFFDKYDAWPYMIVIDRQSYTLIEAYLKNQGFKKGKTLFNKL